jgi:Spy/CpxP family protein refolding chaperone
MKQKVLVIALVASVALNVGALVAFAYRRATLPRPPEPPERMAEELGLTEEQRDAMREQHEKAVKEMEPLRRELHRKRGEVLELLKEPEVDAAKRDRLFAEIAALQMKLELSAFENMCQTKDILAPEQQERFISHVEERFRHRQEHFGRGPGRSPHGREFERGMMRERHGDER